MGYPICDPLCRLEGKNVLPVGQELVRIDLAPPQPRGMPQGLILGTSQSFYEYITHLFADETTNKINNYIDRHVQQRHGLKFLKTKREPSHITLRPELTKLIMNCVRRIRVNVYSIVTIFFTRNIYLHYHYAMTDSKMCSFIFKYPIPNMN